MKNIRRQVDGFPHPKNLSQTCSPISLHVSLRTNCPDMQMSPASNLEIQREWLRGLPKCELHIHLEGTVEPGTLVKLSTRHDAVPLTLADAQKLYHYDDFLGFLNAFFKVTERMIDPEDYELVTYEMVRTLGRQGVRHAEVYVSWGNIFRWKPAGVDAIMAAIERGRLHAEQECGTTVFWIVDAVRQQGLKAAERCVDKMIELKTQYPSIVGIGIGGDEAAGPVAPFKGVFSRAKAAGFHVKAHAGEAVPAWSIRDAIEAGAERIGHALTAIEDANLTKMLAEQQVPLEICITSNLRTGCCRQLDQHPFRKYFRMGLMVTLNSDDPPMFGTTLLDEFELAKVQYNFSNDDMKILARNSVEASFLPLERKQVLLSEIEKY